MPIPLGVRVLHCDVQLQVVCSGNVGKLVNQIKLIIKWQIALFTIATVHEDLDMLVLVFTKSHLVMMNLRRTGERNWY